MSTSPPPDISPLIGPFISPPNDLHDQKINNKSAIHSSSSSGLLKGPDNLFPTGPPIHGTTHHTQFAPLLFRYFTLEAFMSTGCLSTVFHIPVTHKQPVRCALCEPASRDHNNNNNDAVTLYMENLKGDKVLTGTATVGRLDPIQRDASAVRQLLAKSMRKNSARSPSSIIKVNVGDTSPRETVALPFTKKLGNLFPYTYEEKLSRLTEPHEFYKREEGKASPFKRPIIPLEAYNILMTMTLDKAKWSSTQNANLADERAIAWFGACEVRAINGPIHPEENYTLSREIVHIGSTKKAESVWLETKLMQHAVVVADMLLQIHFLKPPQSSSSKL
ncbi:hypothetical protein RI054_17g79870 [Pseudoscourfieldia marina]